MPIPSDFYLNAPSLGSATAVFYDAALTICADDGFYSDGTVVREQVGCVLLPQQSCPACCNELCSGWTAYPLPLEPMQVQYTDCTTGELTTEVFLFATPICVQKGTTPIITIGNGTVENTQPCGCCTETCSTYTIKNIVSYAEVSYFACGSTESINDVFYTEEDICVNTGIAPILVEGQATIIF